MAKDKNTLEFKLKIDGKEAIAVLDLTKGEFVEVSDAAVKSNEKIKQAYQNLTNEALKNNTVTEGTVDTLVKYIQSQELSVDMIEKTITALKNETDTLPMNSTAWKQKMAAADNLKLAMSKVSTEHVKLGMAQSNMLPGQQQTNMAMMQFGYVLNDAQMFMVNARMGIMGIANNIPMIVQGLMQAKQAAGANVTTWQLLSASLMGGGGVIVGINALMFLLQLLPGLFNKSTEAIQIQKDEIKKLTSEYEKLTQQQIRSKRAENEIALSNLTKEFQNKYGDRSDFLKAIPLGIGNLFSAFAELDEEEQKRYNALVNEKNALDEASKKVGYRKDLENSINQLMEKRDTIKNKDSVDAFDEQIKYYRKQLKETEIKNDNDGKTKVDDAFRNAEKEMDIRQQHAVNLAKLEGESDTVILEMKRQNLVEKIGLYEKYGEDILALTLELVETQKQIEISTASPSVNIDSPEDSPLLGDVLATEDYKNQLHKNELDSWYALEDQRISAYENYAGLKAILDQEYYAKKEALEQQSLIRTLAVTSQLLGQLSSLFGKHTAAYKLLAISQVWIETYKGVMALYAPPPVGVGPVMAPLMTAAVIGMGALQAANIAKQDTEMKGYFTGGRLPAGRAGIIEGTHNELIAPEEDFISVVNDLVGQSIISAKHYFASGGGDSDLANELYLLRIDINELMSRTPYAIVEDDTAFKIGDKWDSERRSNR